MELIPLGTNGYHPSFGRQTTSFLGLTEQQAILLDAGTGLGRLTEQAIRSRIDRFESLTILLSHYHLDHIIGLSYLPGVWSSRHVTIFAPAPPFVDATPETALNRLLAPPFFPKLEDFPLSVDIVSMPADSFSIGNMQIRIRRQRHPGGSVGIRIDDQVVYMTDTMAEDGPLPFILGTRILLHESWFLETVAPEAAERVGHSDLPKVLDLAAACRVPQLMPMHFNPQVENSALDVIREKAATKGVNAIIPVEGRSYEV